MSKRPGSITRRLLFAILFTFPLLLILTGIAIDKAHTNSLLKAEYDRLRLQFFALLGAMEWQEGHLIMGDRLQEARFNQFRSGLYGEVSSDTGKPLWQSLSSDSLELPVVSDPPKPGQAVHSETIVDGEALFLYRYLAIWESESGLDIPLLFSIYAAKAPFAAEQHRFQQQLAIWLGLVLALSMALSVVVLYWGLRPLRQLAKDLASLERGDRLTLGDAYPRELTGVTSNLNQLLSKEQKQRERYRNTLADLAHSLKTPLAVLRSEDLSAPDRREQLQRMENIVAYQLQRAVGSGKHNLLTKLPLRPLLERLATSLKKVYRTKNPDIQITLDSSTKLAMDEQDCMELFGNLLDNACKACQTRVVVSGHVADGIARIEIDDDGEGINEQQRETLLQRGKRGDQYDAGQGIGLAVVRDIIESYDATIDIAQAEDLGGARVILALPI
jgi:two-component system, OmpR family, sensor histidine kinase PhoQ